MKKALRKPAAKITSLLAVWLVTGCHTIQSSLPPAVRDLGPSYRPTNFYRRYPALPVEVRRVALLPVSVTNPTADLQAGVGALELLVYAELQKSKRFEVILVTPEQMQQWTGKKQWRTDEELPPDFFDRLSQDTSCDAVMFCQLTRFQPYPPLAVGWKFSLVQYLKSNGSPSTPQILWSADEVLDSGDPEVATGARNYYSQHLRSEEASADPSTMLSSPTRFGQYTLGTLFATIPERQPSRHQ